MSFDTICSFCLTEVNNILQSSINDRIESKTTGFVAVDSFPEANSELIGIEFVPKLEPKVRKPILIIASSAELFLV